MWILLGMIIIGVVIMEWPMNPNKKKKGGKNGRDS